MAQILGQHKVVRHGPLRLWPERGLVHMEDARDNSYETLSVKDALLRVKGISDMVKNSLARERTKNGAFYSDEIRKYQQFVDDMVQVCKIAQEQGSPDDPTAKADLKRRRPTTVSVPKNVKE